MAQDANTQVRTSWKDLHAHTTLTFTRGLLGFSCSLDRHGGLWRLSFPPPKLSFCFSLHFKIHIGTMFSQGYHNLAHLNTVVILQFVTILLKQFHTSPHTLQVHGGCYHVCHVWLYSSTMHNTLSDKCAEWMHQIFIEWEQTLAKPYFILQTTFCRDFK